MHKPDEGVAGLRFLHPRLTSLWRALTRVDADVYYQRTAAAYTGFLAHFCRRHRRKSIYAGASDVDFLPGLEDIRFTRDQKIFEWGVRRVDRIVTQNDVQQKQLFDHYGIEGVVIPSCYVPPPGARCDRGGYVLWTASVRPSKRAELALEIARRLPNYRFVVIGGPDPDRKSRAYYASLVDAARAAQCRDEGLRAVQRSRGLVQRRAAGPEHVALRGISEHVSSSVVAWHAHGGLRRHGLAHPGRGARLRRGARRGAGVLEGRAPDARRHPVARGFAPGPRLLPRQPLDRCHDRPLRARDRAPHRESMSPAIASLERRAVSLGSAYALDYGLQFLLPVVLTRTLDAVSFGEYRLLWLAVSTLLVVMTICMPQRLYYFLPRSGPAPQRLYLHQFLLFLGFAGVASALLLSPLDPFLPAAMPGLVTPNAVVVPIFAALWVFSWLLDVLPPVHG